MYAAPPGGGCPATAPGCPGYHAPAGASHPASVYANLPHVNFGNLSAVSHLGNLNDTVPCGNGHSCYASPYAKPTWAGWTSAINWASSATTVLALATSWIPVVDVVTGGIAGVTDALAGITNAVNTVRDFRNPNVTRLQTGETFLTAALSFLGAGAAAKALKAGWALGDAADAASTPSAAKAAGQQVGTAEQIYRPYFNAVDRAGSAAALSTTFISLEAVNSAGQMTQRYWGGQIGMILFRAQFERGDGQ